MKPASPVPPPTAVPKLKDPVWRSTTRNVMSTSPFGAFSICGSGSGVSKKPSAMMF